MVSVFFTITIFYFFYTINNNLTGDLKINGKEFQGVSERFIATLAVFFNILPFIIYMRVRKDHSMRGVGIVTVILALFLLVYYYILDNNSLMLIKTTFSKEIFCAIILLQARLQEICMALY